MVLSVASLGVPEEETSVITRKALNHYRKTATLQMGRQVRWWGRFCLGTFGPALFRSLIYVQYLANISLLCLIYVLIWLHLFKVAALGTLRCTTCNLVP